MYRTTPLVALISFGLLLGCSAERDAAPAASAPAAAATAAPAAPAEAAAPEVEFIEWASTRDTRPAKALYPTPVGTTE